MDPDFDRLPRRPRRRRVPIPPERPEKVDPSSQGPVDETLPSEEEGQEGVGPGPRDAERRAPKRGEEEAA